MTEPAAIEPRPALKEIFDEAKIRSISAITGQVAAGFDERKFIAQVLSGHSELSLMQRLRRTTESLHAQLPHSFLQALPILDGLAERMDPGFSTLILPDYVALYGQDHFDDALEALRRYTQIGSAEFAVRHFLRRDTDATLATMLRWTQDPSDHVRRLASEGSRPSLPWGLRVGALLQTPPLAADILQALGSDDDSKYVRISVANHLNDISKIDPHWVISHVNGWFERSPSARSLVRQALRTMIKKGDRLALNQVGAGQEAQLVVDTFSLTPTSVSVGGSVQMLLELRSIATKVQHLVIDYSIGYVKKAGDVRPKVFKLRTIDLPAGSSLSINRPIAVHDLSTRIHHPGMHSVKVIANGNIIAESAFDLKAPS